MKIFANYVMDYTRYRLIAFTIYAKIQQFNKFMILFMIIELIKILKKDFTIKEEIINVPNIRKISILIIKDYHSNSLSPTYLII